MIRVELGDDHVARITLDRPEAKNALSVEMRDDLVGAVRQARADADVRALGEGWTDTATVGRVELTFWLLFNQPPS